MPVVLARGRRIFRASGHHHRRHGADHIEEETPTRHKRETIATDTGHVQPTPRLLILKGPRPLPSVQSSPSPTRCLSPVPTNLRLGTLYQGTFKQARARVGD